jgi:Carboxypeptidase regulatory-like domain
VKKLVLAIALLAVVSLGITAAPAFAQQPQTRSLQGEVMNDADAPIASAIVYLKNTKTLAVKTFICDKDGIYRFTALSPNVDYEVYAEKDGKKSDTRTLSSFDSKKQATINLKIK